MPTLPQVTDSVGYELALRRLIAELQDIAGALPPAAGPPAAEPPAAAGAPAEQAAAATASQHDGSGGGQAAEPAAAATAAHDGGSSGGTAAGQGARGQGSRAERGSAGPAASRGPVPLEALPGELLQKLCGEVLDTQTLFAAYRWGQGSSTGPAAGRLAPALHTHAAACGRTMRTRS